MSKYMIHAYAATPTILYQPSFSQWVWFLIFIVNFHFKGFFITFDLSWGPLQPSKQTRDISKPSLRCLLYVLDVLKMSFVRYECLKDVFCIL